MNTGIKGCLRVAALLLFLFGSLSTTTSASDITQRLVATNHHARWIEQVSNTTNRLNDVHFVNRTYGWAVGAAGTLLHSQDGGRTWAHQLSTVGTTLHAVYFVDKSMGWAVGDQGVILHTADGGRTWLLQQSNTTEALRALDFVDEQHGWVVGENSIIRATSDGGATWRTQTPPMHFRFFVGAAVDFWDQQHGWIAPWSGSPDGGILATTDGGETWVQQPTNGVYYLTGVHSASADEGWAAGYEYLEPTCQGRPYHAHLFHTSDGGATWTDIADLCGFTGAIDFADAAHGWLLLHDDTGIDRIMSSADGGTTWAVEHTAPRVHALDMLDQYSGWAVGDNGVILRYSTMVPFVFLPLLTEEGGVEWR